MMAKRNSRALKHAVGKRIINQSDAKMLNQERLKKVFESRKPGRLSAHSDMLFHCECDGKTCDMTILMSTEEYQRVHREAKHFVVVGEHVQLDIEEVLLAFNNFVLVEKFLPVPSKP